MQNVDPARIERNVLKMKSMGASDDEIKQYLDEEDGKVAGPAPAKPKPAQVGGGQAAVPDAAAPVNADAAFAPTPDPLADPFATPAPTQSRFKPEEQQALNDSLQEELKAYVIDQHAAGTLTPEGLNQFYKDISNNRLMFEDPAQAVADFTKSGFGKVTYATPAGTNPLIEKAKAAPAVEESAYPTGPAQNFGVRQLGALNEGIADTLGFPVDLMNTGLAGLDAGADALFGEDGIRLSSDKPFLGSDSIRSGMHSLGMGQVDETYAPRSALERYTQAAARGTGQALIPVLGTISRGGQLVNAGYQTAKQGQGAVRTALADDAVSAFKRPAGSISTEVGAGVGANVAGELADDVAPGNDLVKAGLMLTGGVVGGGTAGAVSKRSTTGRREDRWVDKVLKQDGDNPALPYVPEVAEDLYTVVQGGTKFGKKAAPEGRAVLTIKQVNDLEDRYLSDVAGRIQKLDIPPSQKAALAEAIKGKHSLDGLNVDLLRNGTPEGDFVADAITKTQTLRKMTPEIPRSIGPQWVKEGLSLGTGVGTSIAGGPLLGPLVSIGTRLALRGIGDNEAARVNSAEKVVKNINRYRKLGDITGPSTYLSNRDQFMAITDEAMDTPYLLKKQKQAEAEAEAAARQEAKAGLYPDRPLEDLDIRFPQASQPVKYRKQDMDMAMMPVNDYLRNTAQSPLYKELSDLQGAASAEEKAAAALAKEQAKAQAKAEKEFEKEFKAENKDIRSQAADAFIRQKAKNDYERGVTSSEKAAEKWQKDFEAAMAPPAPPKGKQPSALDLAIQKNIEAGIPGTSNVQKAFADRVGVSNEDMLRALDKVAADVPDLAEDINRIKFGYPTKTQRGVADVLVPRMQKVLEQDGTLEGYRAKAVEAQAREEAMRKVSGAEAPKAEVKTASPKRAAEGNMIGISRPEQWEQGKGRYMAMADEATSRFYQDITVPEEAYSAIGNAPDVIKNKYKTSSEAREFINDVVVEDLRIKGVSPDDIAKVKAYLFEIAEAKPYDTPEALKKGTQKLASTK
jgi:hypothetical protein